MKRTSKKQVNSILIWAAVLVLFVWLLSSIITDCVAVRKTEPPTEYESDAARRASLTSAMTGAGNQNASGESLIGG